MNSTSVLSDEGRSGPTQSRNPLSTHGAQEGARVGDAVERVASGGVVLLDEEELGAGRLGCGQDLGPVHVALTHLGQLRDVEERVERGGARARKRVRPCWVAAVKPPSFRARWGRSGASGPRRRSPSASSRPATRRSTSWLGGRHAEVDDHAEDDEAAVFEACVKSPGPAQGWRAGPGESVRPFVGASRFVVDIRLHAGRCGQM